MSITYHAEQHHISVLYIQQILYKHKVFKTDLANDGDRFACESNKDYTISNVSNLSRTCNYIRDEADKFSIN